MMKWQPIETAPKDGTHFLAYWPEHDLDPHMKQYHVCHYAHGAIWPCWITEDDLPTHWMPLPPPPTNEQEWD